jgi:hypothetical protein
MTVREKRNKVIELCNEWSKNNKTNLKVCQGCPCSNVLSGYCAINADWDVATEKDLDKALGLFEKAKDNLQPTPNPTPNKPNKPDMINHPPHYCREGGMECLDEMKLIFGEQALKHFCLLNAWKYRYRASSKNGEEDLKKSDFYLNKYKELVTENWDEY